MFGTKQNTAQTLPCHSSLGTFLGNMTWHLDVISSKHPTKSNLFSHVSILNLLDITNFDNESVKLHFGSWEHLKLHFLSLILSATQNEWIVTPFP